jgi:Mn-dependent DtxR family transcriptional regulator
LLGQSHAWNQERVNTALAQEIGLRWDTVIIVDNTNMNFLEMKPYILMALKYEYEIEFKEADTWWKYDVEECFERNTHGVPYATIKKMGERWEDHMTVIRKLKKLKESNNV